MLYGVEIEAGWKKTELPALPIPARMKGDGSLRTSPGLSSMYECEIGPGSLTDMVKSIPKIYANVKGINESCGLHIHTSMLPAEGDVKNLCSMRFYDFFMANIYTAVPKHIKEAILTRMCHARGSMYCRPLTYQQLVKITRGHHDRYRAVNWSAYRKFKTVEFRLFPAMAKAADVVSALMAVDSIIQEWNERHCTISRKEVLEESRETAVDVDNYTPAVLNGDLMDLELSELGGSRIPWRHVPSLFRSHARYLAVGKETIVCGNLKNTDRGLCYEDMDGSLVPVKPGSKLLAANLTDDCKGRIYANGRLWDVIGSGEEVTTISTGESDVRESVGSEFLSSTMLYVFGSAGKRSIRFGKMLRDAPLITAIA